MNKFTVNDRIKLILTMIDKKWSNNSFSLIELFSIGDDGELLIKCYKYQYWKDLISKGYNNDDLIKHFLNFLYDELDYLRNKPCLFLFKKEFNSQYMFIDYKGNPSIPIQVQKL